MQLKLVSKAQCKKCVGAYRPPVVDQDVENTENNHEDNGAPLGLESNDNHHARHKSEDAHENPPEAPRAGKDEPDEQENQQHTSRELDIHLAVLLVELREPGRDEALAHPGIREDHEEATNDAEVADEEGEVEDETVTEGLGDDDAEKACDAVFTSFPGNDEERADKHRDDVCDQEEVRYSPGN